MDHWELMRPYLAGMRLVAMDLRGHGRSAPPADDDYGWDAHLADVRAVVDAVHLRSPFVVGHSLGGMIAACYAAEQPDCPGIVDLDGLGVFGVSDEVTRRLADMIGAIVASLGDEIVTADEAEALVAQARAQMELLGIDPDFEEAATRRALVPDHGGSYRHRPPPQSQAAIFAPLEGWDLFAVLRGLTCPALVVQGEQQPIWIICPPTIGSSWPRSTLVSTAGSVDCTTTVPMSRSFGSTPCTCCTSKHPKPSGGSSRASSGGWHAWSRHPARGGPP